jgi:hypothetical protein
VERVVLSEVIGVFVGVRVVGAGFWGLVMSLEERFAQVFLLNWVFFAAIWDLFILHSTHQHLHKTFYRLLA